MKSIKFPKMFNTNSTRVWKATEHLQATRQNTTVLLHCERGELFGDPYFGLMLKHYLFDQNNYVLKDAIIDIIYTQLAIFIPQVKIERKDISIVQDKEKGKLYCAFTGTDQIDFTTNNYNLVLLENND